MQHNTYFWRAAYLAWLDKVNASHFKHILAYIAIAANSISIGSDSGFAFVLWHFC